MADHSADFNPRRPWARTGFDIEGWVGALAALLFGIFAGSFWYPFFIIGLVGAVIVLAATRKVERTMPDGEFRVIAPCDGVVSSIARIVPPTEFELGDGERIRIRLSSSPFSPNPLFSPMTGPVTVSAFEEGDPSRLFASSADAGGLEVSYLTIGSGADAIGLKIMTAGFGPRLDVETEEGDLLRAGRKFAKRRLGGWCDIILPAGFEAAVWPGQSIVGGETELAALSETWVVREPEPDARREEAPGAREPKKEIGLEELGAAHSTAVPNIDEEPEEPEQLTSKLFAKLRREAQGLDDEN